VTETTRHVDSVTLRQPERTEEGYIRVEGIVATPGVLAYHRGGEIVREYVPESTLRDETYLQSLDGKSIVVEHPEGERVGPGNVRMLEVGTCFDNRYIDGAGHGATFLIKTPRGIDAYEDGICELSPAYDARLKEQSGIYDGERYDLVQVKRKAGNHIAMTRKARGGDRTAFHADSWVLHADTDGTDHDRNTDSTPQGATMSDDEKMHQVDLDGRSVPFRADAADVVQQYKKDQEEQQAELSSELQEAKDRISEFKSEIDELKAQLDKKKSQLEVLRQEMGLGEGEMPSAGEGEGDEMMEGEDMEGENMDMSDKDMREDAVDPMEFYRKRRRLDGVAAEMGIEDFEEMDTEALQKAIVADYLGEEKVDESRLDSQCEAITEVVEDGAKRRDASRSSANQRTQRDDSTGGGESTSRFGAWQKAQ